MNDWTHNSYKNKPMPAKNSSDDENYIEIVYSTDKGWIKLGQHWKSYSFDVACLFLTEKETEHLNNVAH